MFHWPSASFVVICANVALFYDLTGLMPVYVENGGIMPPVLFSHYLTSFSGTFGTTVSLKEPLMGS
jgi:hypothetical protein